jgi:hypothetical protein
MIGNMATGARRDSDYVSLHMQRVWIRHMDMQLYAIVVN